MQPGILIIFLFGIAGGGDDGLESRRTSLAQLPLDKLLHVKQAVAAKGDGLNLYDKQTHYLPLKDAQGGIADIFEKGETEEIITGEGALPLRGNDLDKRRRRKPGRRGDSWDDDKHMKSKGDISSIFQSTITILSFLAFGGYLLCLITQAVKQSVNPGQMPMITTVAPAAFIGRKRKKRSPEVGMVDTLHRLAEGYAKYSLGGTATLEEDFSTR